MAGPGGGNGDFAIFVVVPAARGGRCRRPKPGGHCGAG